MDAVDEGADAVLVVTEGLAPETLRLCLLRPADGLSRLGERTQAQGASVGPPRPPGRPAAPHGAQWGLTCSHTGSAAPLDTQWGKYGPWMIILFRLLVKRTFENDRKTTRARAKPL